ncbi:hypothetical protein [Labilibaculum euxinus]
MNDNFKSESIELEIERNGDDFHIDLKELFYYQDKVEVERLINVDQSKPVTLVNYEERIILINGYHRLFLAMLDNKKSIKGKIINLQDLVTN